jgi:regulator of replication initiation timing
LNIDTPNIPGSYTLIDMSDTKKKMTQITVEDVHTLLQSLVTQVNALNVTLEELRDENRALHTEAIFKMQGDLVKRPLSKPKKLVVKKDKTTESKDKEPEKQHVNAMYYWAASFAAGESFTDGFATPEEIADAEAKCDKLKDKPEGVDRKRSVGLTLWKSFFGSPKKAEIKTLFINWKLAQAQLKAKDVKKEENTDDENEVSSDEEKN